MPSHPENQPNTVKLDRADLKKTRERVTISAGVVHEVIREEGEQELQRSTEALAWSGLAAGLSMGFSMLAQGIILNGLAPSPSRKLIAGFGYTLGFVIVVLGRQQLFTENTLTPILPLMQEMTWRKFARVMKLWATVLATNLIGTLLFAWAIADTSLFGAGMQHTLTDLGRHAIRPFAPMVLGAVFAGWLVALMVWLLPAAETARVIIIILLTYVISIAGFPHLIAGSVEAFYLVLRGVISWQEYFTRFMIPTFIGNVSGGVILVAALNHAQATAGAPPPEA
ncbi:MAG: formate/nitrite transporter family protein [Acidiferrobacter sp.]